jgi:hypothetical protein
MFLKPILSPKMRLWQQEAYREIGIDRDIWDLDCEAAIFPRSLYEPVSRMDQTKIYDICFVGAYKVDERTTRRRHWLIHYVRRNFTDRSYLQFTDSKTKKDYVPLGPFDFTLSRSGFVPKEVPRAERNVFDAHYYQVLCHSQFALCPAGDRRWSMRFYEALMCKSIPVLRSRTHHRSIREAVRGYKTYSARDELVYRQDWVDHNYKLFQKHHTLSHRG